MKTKMMMVYVYSLILIMNSNSTFLLWILLELNMLIFILMMEKEEKSKSQNSLFYFMIQSLASIVILISSISETIQFSQMSKMILILAIMIKMGIFPTHIWMYEISKSMKAINLSVLLTLQKLPILMILSLTSIEMTNSILIMSAIMGSIFIWKSKNIKEMMISSSIYSTIWMVMILNISMNIFFLMYTMYSMSVFMILKQTEMDQNLTKSSTKVITIASLMFLMGIPPSSMILFKIYTINFLFSSMTLTGMLLIWMSTFIATMAYIKLMMKKTWTQVKNFNISMWNEKITLKVSSMILIFSSLLILS